MRAIPLRQRNRIVRWVQVVTVAVPLTAGANAGETASRLPLPVSPGGPRATLAISNSCPTFSWADPAAGDTAHQLAVFAVDQDGRTNDRPHRLVDVPAGATSFTLSGAACLDSGRYGWSMRRTRADGPDAAWSAPLFFSIQIDGRELKRAVDRALTLWLEESRLSDGTAPSSAARGKASEASSRGPSHLAAAEFTAPCDPLDPRTFSDVGDSDPACPWIEKAYFQGFAESCATDPLRFCPQDVVRRDQVAAMVGKAVEQLEADICAVYQDPLIECLYVPGFCAAATRTDCCPTHHKRVFVSSVTTTGNLQSTCSGLGLDECASGVASGNAICQHLAAQAGLTGSFKAWLSTVNGGPDTGFSHPGRPYCRVDNVRVANSWADLVDCAGGDCLAKAIELDETGGNAYEQTWTATLPSGAPISAPQNFCASWTSSFPFDAGGLGSVGPIDATWTAVGNASCDDVAAIYCFEQ